MEDFASGMLAGIVLLVAVFGLIKFGLWCGETENRIERLEMRCGGHKSNINYLSKRTDEIEEKFGKVETDVTAIKVAVTSMVQSLKGKQNENVNVAGQKPAGPEKTS